MRILFVSERAPYLPCPDADRAASAELLAMLAERHDVSVLGAAEPGDSELQRRWSSRHAVSAEILPGAPWRRPLSGAPDIAVRALGDALERRAARFQPDVVYLDGAMVAPLAGRCQVPTVLAPHASRARAAAARRTQARSPLGWLAARLAEHAEARWERQWFSAASACIVRSDDDRAALSHAVPAARIDVVAPGIDLARYAYRRIPAEAERLVFAGDLAFPPHVDAAWRFATAVLPRVRRAAPRAELLCVGTAPAPAARRLARLPGVRVLAPVADVRPSVWSASVCVSPLAGSARSLLLPAMALGTPVVASPASLGPIVDGVVAGQHVLVAGDDGGMVDAVLMMLGHRIVAHTLARNARELIERRYSWATVTTAHEAVLARVIHVGGLDMAPHTPPSFAGSGVNPEPSLRRVAPEPSLRRVA